MKLSTMKTLLVVVTLVSAPGCEWLARDYTIGVHNATQSEMTSVSVQFGEYKSTYGVLISGATKTRTGMRAPVPAISSVEWLGADGKAHRREVSTRHLHRESLGGDELIFEIQPDDTVLVKVRPQPGTRVSSSSSRRPPPAVTCSPIICT